MSTDRPIEQLQRRMTTLPRTPQTPQRAAAPQPPVVVTPQPVATVQSPATMQQPTVVPQPPATPQPLPPQSLPPQPLPPPPVGQAAPVMPSEPAFPVFNQPVPVFPGISPSPSTPPAQSLPMPTQRRHPPPQAASLPLPSLQAQFQPQQPVPFQQMMQDILNRNLLPGQKFGLVVVPDDASPAVLYFNRVEDLINEVRVYLDTNTSLFPFLGYPLQISSAPNRFLRTPFGLLPLFVMPREEELVFADNGFVGLPEPPLPPPAPTSSVDEAADDAADSAEAAVDPLELADPPLDDDSPVAPLDGG